MEIVGKIVLMPKGNYDASTTYEHLDWVRYNGSSWVCKQDGTTGVTPTEGTTWSCIAENGDTGDGLNATHSKVGKTTTVTITNSRTGATVDTFTIMDGADGSGAGTTDYTALTNKPTINNVELSGNKTSADLGLASSSSVPTKVSQLTNDSGYLTSQYIEDVETTQFDVTGKKLSLDEQIKNKISAIDGKITNPTTKSDGQVLTYNGTSGNWEAKDSQGGGSAEDIEYDNTTSGLTATDVQSAVDEISEELSTSIRNVSEGNTDYIVMKQGHLTTLSLRGHVAIGVTPNTWFQLMTLNNDEKPLEIVQSCAQCSDTSAISTGIIKVAKDGTVYLNTPRSGTVWISSSITYISK